MEYVSYTYAICDRFHEMGPTNHVQSIDNSICGQMAPSVAHMLWLQTYPDGKVHVAHMGPTWGRQDPGGPHVGPMNLAIRDEFDVLHHRANLSSIIAKPWHLPPSLSARRRLAAPGEWGKRHLVGLRINLARQWHCDAMHGWIILSESAKMGALMILLSSSSVS